MYGTTTFGGNTTPCVTYTAPTGCGTIFELSPNGSGGWTENVLYRFQGSPDGANPNEVIFGGSGILYGVSGGGSTSCQQYVNGFDCGTVYEMHRTPSGWVKSTLYLFKGGTDGFAPGGSLALDASGNLYGATGLGGIAFPNAGDGTVYQLSQGLGGYWTETVIYTFTGLLDGADPMAGVLLDSSGSLYGLTIAGGTTTENFGGGTLFKLTPNSGGQWSENTIYSFQNIADGLSPQEGQLARDGNGNFYATMLVGGRSSANCPYGCGTVVEVAP